MPVPGFLMGNSSSSMEFDMGIGPDILPRMLWWPVLGRGPVGEAGPNIFGFMVGVWLSRVGVWVRVEAPGPWVENLNGGREEDAMIMMSDVDIDGGPDEPSGITIMCSNFQAVKMIRDEKLVDYSSSTSPWHRSTWSEQFEPPM